MKHWIAYKSNSYETGKMPEGVEEAQSRAPIIYDEASAIKMAAAEN